MIMLCWMDLDLAMQIEPPAALTDTSTTQERMHFEKWECFNHMSLMIMKHAIPKTLRESIPEEKK